VARLIDFKRWNSEAPCSGKHHGEDEGVVCMENLLETGSITEDRSSPVYQQSEDCIKHHSRETSAPATKKGGLLRKYFPRFKKHSGKKKKSLESKIKALEKEVINLTFTIMFAHAHINTLKMEHEDIQKKLQNDRYKKDVISRERNSLVRQVKKMREKRGWLRSTATEIDVGLKKAVRYALKPEAENLRGQCVDAAALKEQLNIAKVERPKVRKKRRAPTLIAIVLVLCFSVGLLWILRDSLNNYGTPFASSRKISWSRNPCIIAATAPFFNIIV
jgi:hypothetical protein